MADDPRITEILSEWETRHRLGEAVALEDLCVDRPELVDKIRERLEGLVTVVPPWHAEQTHVAANKGPDRTSLDAGANSATDPSAGTMVQSGEMLAQSQAASLGLGQIIPGYDGLQELGRGGIGVVYRARQLKPNRIVAIKMMIGGAHAGEVNTARFLDEAEAIARIRHPNIVQIFEVGTHNGQPYFSLEFCDGGSLKDKLAGQPIPPRAAAALVENLARAMQTAHDDGIIHRDLKPANILLSRLLPSGKSSRGESPDGDWTLQFEPWNFAPKIADFGLAKLEGTEHTATGAIMGTPSYMAPEQAEGRTQDVGPRTDVWALGAILYECLTGRPPFRAATPIETIRQVASAEPVPPSRLNSSVLRDLETICLECLQKEPARRYACARDLADDLRRFLDGKPVTARPVRTIEHVWRWCRRNPGLASAVACSVGSLVLGTVVSVLFAVRASRNEREALRAADRERAAKEVAQNRLGQLEKANDVLGSLFRDLDPKAEEKGGPPLRVELSQRLELASKLIDGEAIGDPLTVARLQDTLGRSQTSLGNPSQAIDLLSRAFEARRRELGPDHEWTLSSLVALARAHHEAGNFLQAVHLGEDARAKLRDLRGPSHPETLTCMSNLALACRAAGQLTRARTLDEETYRRRLELLGPDDADTITSMSNLAGTYFACGEYSQGLPLFEQALEKRSEKLGPGHFLTLRSLSNLAGACLVTGQRERSLQLYERALGKMKDTLGPDHPTTLSCMQNLAGACQNSGNLKRALTLFQQCLDLSRARLGPNHPDTIQCTRSYSLALHQNGETAGATTLIENAVDQLRSRHGPTHPETLKGAVDLAFIYASTRQLDKARALLEQTLKTMETALPADHPSTLNCMNHLARVYLDGRDSRAGELLSRTVAKMRERLGRDHPDTLVCTQNLARFQFGSGNHAESLNLFEEVLEKRRANLGPDHPQTLNVINELARAYHAAGQPERAVGLLEPALPLFQTRFGPEDLGTLFARLNLGRALLAAGKTESAKPMIRETLNGYRKRLAADPMRLADLFDETAADFRKHGHEAEAKDLANEASMLRLPPKPTTGRTS